jgi:hypothetical protein
MLLVNEAAAKLFVSKSETLVGKIYHWTLPMYKSLASMPNEIIGATNPFNVSVFTK